MRGDTASLEFGSEDFKYDIVEGQVEVHKQDPCIGPWLVKVLQN